MNAYRLLFMHVTAYSGHHSASRAIERTVLKNNPHTQIASVDAFDYSSRWVRWAIYSTYYSLIRHQPDVWEYLYDNPKVHRRIEYLRALLHRYQRAKFQRLIDTVKPDAIICTQAYPCGMAADFKTRYCLDIPLIGVLTDYVPHLYWFNKSVDCYVVPSEQVRQRFLERGVGDDRIKVLGIPIDERFADLYEREAVEREFALEPGLPIVLIMGGSCGLGQMGEVVQQLDSLPNKCQFVVVTGTNHRLYQSLVQQQFRHPMRVLGYVDAAYKLMSVASLLISKPGGLTTAESLTTGTPMVIVNPIPGQEVYNARFLISERAAVQAGSPALVRQTVRDLLDAPERLRDLKHRALALARPYASQEITQLIYDLIEQQKIHAPAVSSAVSSEQNPLSVA